MDTSSNDRSANDDNSSDNTHRSLCDEDKLNSSLQLPILEEPKVFVTNVSKSVGVSDLRRY